MQSDECPNCKKQMTLEGKVPVLLSCKCEVCIDCLKILSNLNGIEPQDSLQSLKCPNCQQEQKVDIQLEELRAKRIRSKLFPKDQPIPFKCSMHQKMEVANYCPTCNVFFCPQCIKEHKQHIDDTADVTNDQLIEHYMLLNEQLGKLESKVRDARTKIEAVIHGQEFQDSDDLLKTILDAYQLLTKPFVHEQDDLGKLIKYDSSLAQTKFESLIIKESQVAKNLQATLDQGKKLGMLLYRGSRDGFAANAFHQRCDSKGKTLTVIKSRDTGNIFGGFSVIPFKSFGNYVQGSGKSFLFIVKSDKSVSKLLNKNSGKKEIFDRSGNGPCFGGGCDLRVNDNCNTSQCLSNINHTYHKDPDQAYLDGKNYQFYVGEIEIFQIQE